MSDGTSLGALDDISAIASHACTACGGGDPPPALTHALQQLHTRFVRDGVAPLAELTRAHPLLACKRDYVAAGVPFVGRAWCADWPAVSRWPCVCALAAALGSTRVPVTVGSEGYASACKDMPADEYFRVHMRDGSGAYLKDFHLVEALGSAGAHSYRVPAAFSDDYLNAWLDQQRADGTDPRASDYRFLYCGPAGSRTPLHHDVMRSLSFSANVRGVKLWVFTPAAEAEARLYDAWGNLTQSTLLSANLQGHVNELLPCARAGPAATTSLPAASLRFCVQLPGDAVFVPSGWHHEVLNVTDAVSINHNWINGSCIEAVTLFTLAECARVRRSLQDVQPARDACAAEHCEWEQQCQHVLLLNASINLPTLARLLEHSGRALAGLLVAPSSLGAAHEPACAQRNVLPATSVDPRGLDAASLAHELDAWLAAARALLAEDASKDSFEVSADAELARVLAQLRESWIQPV